MASFDKKAHDEVIDYKCSNCFKKKKKERESEKFCVECNKHFCSVCLDLHNEILDGHTLQEPSQATGQVFLPTDKCPKHQTKLIDTYCKDHDEVVCNTCAFDEHRFCKKVLYIPNEAVQIFKEEELQQVRAGLHRVMDRLTEGGRLRDRQTEVLQTEREKQLEAVDSYVDILVAIIRNLGKAEKKKLIDKFKDEEDKLQQNSDSCLEVMTDIQKCCSQLDSNDENKAQLFVNIKKSQKIITVADQLVQEVKEITKHQSPQFKSDRQIKQYLDGLQTLGSPFPGEKRQNINQPPTVNKPLHMKKTQDNKHKHVVTSTQSPTLYKTGQKQDINIKIKEDIHRCYIYGSCLLSDGSLLLSDNYNKKLKLLDTTTYTVIDHCGLPAHPHGVCCISHQEAAVCLYNNTIQFVSLGSHKMSLTRSIQLNHDCYGISYWDNKLCVSNLRDDVLFYTLSGSLIKPGNLGLSYAYNITFSQAGDAVYIADSNLGLIGVDMLGQEIFRYKGLGLDDCTSVCVDNSGSVFVGGSNSGNVVQVTERGQLLGEVVPQSAGIQRIRTLSFDCSSRRLFVAGLSDTVEVIEMK